MASFENFRRQILRMAICYVYILLPTKFQGAELFMQAITKQQKFFTSKISLYTIIVATYIHFSNFILRAYIYTNSAKLKYFLASKITLM